MASQRVLSKFIDAPSGEGLDMNSFFETIRKLKRSGGAPRMCPRCGSMRIRIEGSLGGWLLPPMYSCEACGYSGRLVLELDESDLSKEEH